VADPRHLHDAVILTAGLGTRLRPLTLVRAKPAIPVAGEPMVRRIGRWLAAAGVTDVVLNLHHLPATLTSVVGDGSDLGLRARYSWEQPVVLGSAGGPRQAMSLIDADRTDAFFIINGDTLTDVDLHALADAHASAASQSGSRPSVTLALTPNRDPLRYGGVRLDDESRVTGSVPRGTDAADSFHFIGVQVANVEAFRSVRPGEVVNSIGGAYDALLAADPGAVRGFVCDAHFWDVGTVADYWNTSFAFMDAGDRRTASIGLRARIDPSAAVTRSIVWDDVTIAEDAVIDECIVTDRVQVPAGARYRRMILRRDERTDALVVSTLSID